MEKLSPKKQLVIVRFYLSGLSYQEICAKAGVSKGTVSNVIADLRSGHFLDLQEPPEKLDLLRELAGDLRRLNLTPGQAILGLTALSHLQQLQIDPAEVTQWAAVYRQLAADETEAQSIIRAAMNLKEVQESTGLSAQELEEKVQTLEKEAAQLEPVARDLKGLKRQVGELQKTRASLAGEVSRLESIHKPLLKSVAQLEKRETELNRRVQKLEDRAQAADERLASARSDLKELANLGLLPDDLHGFVQRLAGLAQRHGMKAGELRERLLRELEALDELIGLEHSIDEKRGERELLESEIRKASEKRKAEERALRQLSQRQADLHALMAQEQHQFREEMKAMVGIATKAAGQLQQGLAEGIGGSLREVFNLRDQALEVGAELGRFGALIEANERLTKLVAIMNGDGKITAAEVRPVMLPILRTLKDWAETDPTLGLRSYSLTTQLRNIIEEIEKWRP